MNSGVGLISDVMRVARERQLRFLHGTAQRDDRMSEDQTRVIEVAANAKLLHLVYATVHP